MGSSDCAFRIADFGFFIPHSAFCNWIALLTLNRYNAPVYPVRNNGPLLPPGQRPSGPAAAAGLDFRLIPAGFNAPLEFLTGFTNPFGEEPKIKTIEEQKEGRLDLKPVDKGFKRIESIPVCLHSI
jgi:hypothetical protein